MPSRKIYMDSIDACYLKDFTAEVTAVDENTSGASYLYIAFAEAPFVNSKGVPCNAR